MKLLHLYHKTYNAGDGITNVVSNLSKYQNKIPHIESFHLAFSSDDKLKQKAEFKTISFFKLLFQIKSYSPDFIYVHGIFKIKSPILITSLKLMGFKIILVPHCSLMKRTILHKKIKKSIYLSIFKKISFQHVNFIQYLNKEEKNDSIFISNKIKTYILPNGVSVNTSIKQKNFKKIKPFYLGRCDIYHKGLDLLINSLDIFYKKTQSNILFNIYGADKKQTIELKNLKPNKNIIIRPPIFGLKKEEVLESNNIFIMTSRYEGLPVSVLEALAYGNICLLTEGTNMAKIVKKYNCGFVIKNINDIYYTLNKIKNMPESELIEMSTNAKNLVNESYNWQSIANLSIKKIIS
ncbi:TPA: glycosyltransferase family 4 protein [Escherichia coli]|uniref:glycosyltransferase family 4 protein n=1 Tax=Escherichia coli TaxID=562 RepID=UPI0014137632|nr:glycosyltransferase family 4 protein [Escherichia coli]NHX21055.1 glycosyltransferase family 4 protein [Escherichia coli]HBD1202828.1 glycosyltransferase family 4 protein [Escherichia coli]